MRETVLLMTGIGIRTKVGRLQLNLLNTFPCEDRAIRRFLSFVNRQSCCKNHLTIKYAR